MLISRTLDDLEESTLLPEKKILYQFSARGHELAQVLLGTLLTHKHDAASGYYRSRPLLLTLGLTVEDALKSGLAKGGGISDGRDIGVVFNMPTYENDDVPDGSVGEPTLGVDVKLSEGNEGEVLMKSFNMFSKYLHDPEATKKAHDEEGYYKTGDVARKEGKYYFIMGRSSIDILKSGGYKISALDVERELLSLPYIAEAMVVGVPDDEFGQRVAAVVSLRTDKLAQDYYEQTGRHPKRLDLNDMRSDVRSRLAGYKMPTLLRVVEGEIPKGGTGKVVKKILGPQFFPENYRDDPDVQVWSSTKRELKPRL